MHEKYYYSIDVPVLYKPFSVLTPEEAEEYFSAFMGVIDGRVQALEVISKVDLDYSKSSLAELWRWFLTEAVTEEAPVPKKKKRKWWQRKTEEPPEPPKNGGLRFTLDTECALWDIAVYFGEVLVREHSSLEWSHSADGMYANMPVITGFGEKEADPEKRVLDPFSAVREEADRIFSNTQTEDDLYRLCREWEAIAPVIPASFSPYSTHRRASLCGFLFLLVLPRPHCQLSTVDCRLKKPPHGWLFSHLSSR